MASSAAATGIGTPAVSVVVTSGGRIDLLDRCLDALLRQTLDGRRYEIIVVDDNHSHNTRQLVAVWRASAGADGPQLAYLVKPGPPCPATARNHGWQAARAAVVAFTDDDTVPSPSWLRHGLAAFDEHVDVLCGRIDVPLDSPPTDHQRAQRQASKAGFSMANCFCRKAILASLGGFDERFRLSGSETKDLHFRLIEAGAHIVQDEHAVVVRPLRSAPWGVSLVELHKLAFDALLYKKHPALYRKNIRATPHWEDYLIVGALLATLLGLATGMATLAMAAGASWLLLTIMLSLHRLRGASRSLSHVVEMLVTSALMPPLAVYWRLAGAIRYRVRFA
jgi:glycosyltransferase involved in cell wall biosynthesis